MDNFAFNRTGEEVEFPKVDCNGLKGQYPVTFKGINIFERANEHFKVPHYVREFEEGEYTNKKGTIHSGRALSIE